MNTFNVNKFCRNKKKSSYYNTSFACVKKLSALNKQTLLKNRTVEPEKTETENHQNFCCAINICRSNEIVSLSRLLQSSNSLTDKV